MSSENIKPEEIKKEEKKPEEVKKEEKKEDKADRTLKPYWYPMEDNEQHELLPSLQKNIIRNNYTTQFIDLLMNLLLLSIVSLIIYMICKQIHNHINFDFPMFSNENRNVLIFIGCMVLSIYGIFLYYVLRKKHVYLLGFSVAKPADEWKTSNEYFDQYIQDIGCFNEESCKFLSRLIRRSGLGDETALPPAFHSKPVKDTMEMGRKEFYLSIEQSMDELFASTKIDPTKDIDFVITNCSMFAPTPSLSALIMNKYKMKQTCRNFSFGGMGCSAGLVSIDLAKDLLNVYPNKTILVYSTESITRGWYSGQEKGKLMSNVLFRMGGASILLTNKRSLKRKAKYELLRTQRIMHAKFDDSYHAIYQSEDEEGVVGAKIGRELLKCVTRALIQNMNMLVPHFMHWNDIFKFIIHFIKQKAGLIDKKEQFQPNFREIFQAYCIHAGGRAIIDGLQENMKLTDEDCYASRAALYRFGNTSSASIWYEFKFIERTHMLKKGDKIWQVAFGSGLKCNSAVWKKISN